MSEAPLEGRVALVTGVSRRRGIGFAVATRFAERLPEDAARLITWLATDDAQWVSGAVIDSTGGWEDGPR